MERSKHIPLFWWSEKRLMGKDKENYGDLLSKYLVEKLSRKEVRWIHPQKQKWYNLNKAHYLAAGSILAHASKHSLVWGSGVVDRKSKIADAEFHAVRGPETRKVLIEQGKSCPAVYGDPAILLPDFYYPKIGKRYELGIIPHYVDFNIIAEKFKYSEGVKVIDMMTLDVEETTNEILACKQIISSSLHGVIVPHAYGIPALWVQFSKKVFGDNIKFFDYYKSVGIDNYVLPEYSVKYTKKEFLNYFKNHSGLPDSARVLNLKEGLWKSCPFRN